MDLNELEHVMIPETYIPHPMDSTTDEGGRHFVCEGGFTLTVMADGKYVNRGNGPRILLCTEGKADVNGLVLEKGQCCIAGDAVKEIDVSCPGGTVFMASGC
jgi:hypothetical protein